MCSFGIGTASLSSSSRDGREDRRRVRELRKHDEPHRQERRAAGDRRVDHRQHAVGVRAHLRRDRADWRSRSGRRRRRSGCGVIGVGLSVGVRRQARSRRQRCVSIDARVVALDDTRDAPASSGTAPRTAGTDTASCRGTAAARPSSGLAELQVHLLAEAVGVEQERPRPAVRERRQRAASNDSAISSPGRETTNMSSVARQQLAHVAFARVAPGISFHGDARRDARRSRSRTARGRPA